MIDTILSYSPLIIATLFIIFMGILSIDDARRHSKDASKKPNKTKG